MRYHTKALIVVLIASYLMSLAGCATAPKKDVISEKDMLIENLTEENAALRSEIERLAEENEALMREKLRKQEKSETIK